MTEEDLLGQLPKPSAERPLIGTTIMLVEDSRFASEAMRLLCLRSGARIRRADCLRAARRHLTLYRPGVVVIDLGLPDGSGLDLVRELARATPRVDVILAISGDPDAEAQAIDAGADGFLQKPILSVGAFQQAILSRLPDRGRVDGLRPVATDEVQPDQAAYHDDLALAADLLTATGAEDRLGYVTQFLAGLALLAGDSVLKSATEGLRDARETGRPWGPDLARLAGLLQDRLDHRQAV